MSSKEKILITGGGGFIGHHLVRELVNDFEIVVIDDFSRGSPTRLEPFENKIELIKLDLRDYEALRKKLINFDFEKIFHLAAINGTENFYKKPLDVMDVGIIGCYNILRFAKERNVKKLIIASSAEVYQEAEKIPTPEEVKLIIPDGRNPRFSYGLSKIYTEFYSYHFGLKNEMNVSIFRPHNVYGPDMGLKHVIPQFVMQFLEKLSINDKKMVIEAKGSLSADRAFCHVNDIIEGIRLISEKNEDVNVYNIGSMEKTKISELIKEISKFFGKDYEVNSISNTHIGGAESRCPDISKISKLGFKPKLSLKEGLSTTIDWYKKNYSELIKVSNTIY
jgi:UDP-glucose 4-epimerase